MHWGFYNRFTPTRKLASVTMASINARPRMIRNMRDLDMPLATIRRVLAVVPISQAQAELLVHQYLEMRERQLELFAPSPINSSNS